MGQESWLHLCDLIKAAQALGERYAEVIEKYFLGVVTQRRWIVR